MNKYKRNNLGMNIELMSGKLFKKGKGFGRLKKDKIKWWNIRWIFKWFK